MATAFAQISSHQQMLGCILEIIAIERLVTVTNTLVLMSIRRLCGFESTELMEIRIGEPLEVLSMLKGCNDFCGPRVGEEIIDGSESKVKLPSKTTVTSSEVGECKDAGSDDDDDEDDDDDQEEEIGEEEEDLSADEGGEDEQNNEEEDQEGEEGGEEANGNDEDDDDEDDEEGEGDDDDDDEDDDDEDEEDDEEDEEPPTKKKK